ncbi:hypothetical protein J4414_01080 [Candidatus Woesearchaeota archaeon]|nr:hypothetical protein [Candidatus Woesearchaeota archaeon]
MVSITVSVPGEVKDKMKKFPEMNWSGFVAKSIIEKTKELSWKEELVKQFREEKDMTDWAVKLQRRARKGRYNKLKEKGWV